MITDQGKCRNLFHTDTYFTGKIFIHKVVGQYMVGVNMTSAESGFPLLQAGIRKGSVADPYPHFYVLKSLIFSFEG